MITGDLRTVCIVKSKKDPMHYMVAHNGRISSTYENRQPPKAPYKQKKILENVSIMKHLSITFNFETICSFSFNSFLG